MENSILFQSLTNQQKSNYKTNLNNYFPHPDFTILFQLFNNPQNLTINHLNKKNKSLLLQYIF